MKLAIIGDVHGYHDEYLKAIEGVENSIQVGDFGFDWDVLDNVDPEHHKVVAGNHDNYAKAPEKPHYLGDFGARSLGGLDFFFVRGEFSIDKHLRTPEKTWWREEELTALQMGNVIDAYVFTKPSVVVSHGCPASIINHVSRNGLVMRPSNTSQLLQVMYEIHQPDIWIFGHHHRSLNKQIGDTWFRCLAELEVLDFHKEYM